MSDSPKTSDEKTLEELFPGYAVDRDALAPAYKALRIKLGIGQFYMRNRDAPKIGFYGPAANAQKWEYGPAIYVPPAPFTSKPSSGVDQHRPPRRITHLVASVCFCIDVQSDDEYLDGVCTLKRNPKKKNNFAVAFYVKNR